MTGPTEEKRAETEELRTELGATVEELAYRVDVPARVKARRDETAQRARVQLDRAQGVLDDKAPAVGRAVRERPAWVAGATLGLPVAIVVLSRLRRRRAR